MIGSCYGLYYFVQLVSVIQRVMTTPGSGQLLDNEFEADLVDSTAAEQNGDEVFEKQNNMDKPTFDHLNCNNQRSTIAVRNVGY